MVAVNVGDADGNIRAINAMLIGHILAELSRVVNKPGISDWLDGIQGKGL